MDTNIFFYQRQFSILNLHPTWNFNKSLVHFFQNKKKPTSRIGAVVLVSY